MSIKITMTYQAGAAHVCEPRLFLSALGTFPRPSIALAVLLTILFSIGPVSAGIWVTNSPLLTTRSLHTATLLQNGKVLVAGGWGKVLDGGGMSENYLSSAELYDPATGAWTLTGPMTTNRINHTATLLPNGKVLVVGGYANVSLTNESPRKLSSAELYDPATGTWTTTSPISNPRVFHTATLLPNGKVLVAGGVTQVYTLVAELYDPASGTWSPASSMKRSRWFHTATLLPNGKVLLAGGDLSNLATSELYDPVNGLWSDTGTMTTNRTGHTATLLSNGQVLVAAGDTLDRVYGGQTSLASVEIYNPSTGIWRPVISSLRHRRSNHTATLLANGTVLVAGGFQDGPGSIASVEMYVPVSEIWTTINSMRAERSDHTATLLTNGRVLVAGGVRNTVTNSTELFDPGNANLPIDPLLTGSRILYNGSFQFSFVGNPGTPFRVLTSANPALPLSNWDSQGGVIEISPGQYQFIDSQATNNSRRFYRIQSQ